MLLMVLNHIRERLSNRGQAMSNLRSLRLDAAAVETLINSLLCQMMELGALQVSRPEVEAQRVSLA
jgi:hypothetical protein